MITPSHYRHRGRFNLLNPSQYSEQVVLRTAHGNISATWPDGECPHDEDMRPSEVAEMLRERIASYLFMGDRAENLAKLDAIKADAAAVDAAWLRFQASSAREKAQRLMAQAQRWEEEAAELTEAA
jgi:hypothetical protein